jgi:hypothetical protein
MEDKYERSGHGLFNATDISDISAVCKKHRRKERKKDDSS